MAAPLVAPLAADVARRITSGQVITSVHAAVKELVENALDAGATSIDVKLEQGGLEVLSVADNGSGIGREDVQRLGQRHHTSKLRDTDDLATIATYGFRGEAVSSLCQMGDVQIVSRTAGDAVGHGVTFRHDGSVVRVENVTRGQGTTVVVRKLFGDLPVRRQGVLAKIKQEEKLVEDVVVSLALIHPRCRVLLRVDQQSVLNKPASVDYAESVLGVFGTELADQLGPVAFKSDDGYLEIKGFLPKPNTDVSLVSRNKNSRCYLYVNQRPVAPKDIISAIVNQYTQHVAQRDPSTGKRYPFIFLNFTLDQSECDVNLEPNKTSILFQQYPVILQHLQVMLERHYPLPLAPIFTPQPPQRDQPPKEASEQPSSPAPTRTISSSSSPSCVVPVLSSPVVFPSSPASTVRSPAPEKRQQQPTKRPLVHEEEEKEEESTAAEPSAAQSSSPKRARAEQSAAEPSPSILSFFKRASPPLPSTSTKPPSSPSKLCEHPSVKSDRLKITCSMDRLRSKHSVPSSATASPTIALLNDQRKKLAAVLYNNGDVCIVHFAKLLQLQKYTELMESFALARVTSDPPVFLDPEAVGGAEAWSLLEKLPSTAIGSGTRFVTDRNLVLNGFDICFREAARNTVRVVELKAVTKDIDNYGVADLRVLLALMLKQQQQQQPNAPVGTIVRPPKVADHLQGLARRQCIEALDDNTVTASIVDRTVKWFEKEYGTTISAAVQESGGDATPLTLSIWPLGDVN